MVETFEIQEQRAQTKRNSVFISYSHKDEQWKDLLLPHLQIFDEFTVWHDRKIDTGEEWYGEIKEVMNSASAAVCLISKHYLSSDFCKKEEIPFLLQRSKEHGMPILPIVVGPCPHEKVGWLSRIQIANKAEVVPEDKADELFSDFAKDLYDRVVDPNAAGLVTRDLFKGDISAIENVAIDLTHLPESSFKLFGRDAEIEKLDRAWTDPKTNSIRFIGWGGTGKTTLVREWLGQLKARHYAGAERVFAWSFYSQGADRRVTSADQFMQTALRWFGDDNPALGSPWMQAERLAKLIRKKPTLLILDGVEPLQWGSGNEVGMVKDPAVSTLLTELAHDNNGLVVATSRVDIKDLANAGKFSLRVDLNMITAQAGRSLLRATNVYGSDQELERAAEEFGCHALAINLLSSYLRMHCNSQISAAREIDVINGDEKDGLHAKRVLTAYAGKLASTDGRDSGEQLDVLRILGLFDRPAPIDAIRALKNGPTILGLTEHLKGASNLNLLLRHMSDLGLLAPENPERPEYIDTHPIIRQFFHDELVDSHPDAWRAGNEALFDYFSNAAPAKPSTVDEIAPLYSAIVHGCRAGQHKRALNEIFRERVRRDYWHEGLEHHRGYSTTEHSLFGADLAALSNFTDEIFANVTVDLPSGDKAFILSKVGFCLQALGRLDEAETAMRAGLDLRVRKRNWYFASVDGGYLSDLYLLRGNIDLAKSTAREAVDRAKVAKRLDNIAFRLVNLAVAHHQAGDMDDAEDCFNEADALLKADDPNYPELVGERAFYYCDLLLDRAMTYEARKRADRNLEVAKARKMSPLAHALHHLSIGYAHLIDLRLTGTGDLLEAEKMMNRAVNGLREAQSQHHMPRAYLARAELRLYKEKWKEAKKDLERCLLMSKQSGMRLFEAEAEILLAFLAFKTKDAQAIQSQVEKAEALVEEMGFGRRTSACRRLGRLLDNEIVSSDFGDQ